MKNLLNGIKQTVLTAIGAISSSSIMLAATASAMLLPATPAQAYGNCPGIYVQELVQGYWRCVRPWGYNNPCLDQYEWYIYDPRFGAFCVLR